MLSFQKSDSENDFHEASVDDVGFSQACNAAAAKTVKQKIGHECLVRV